MVTSFVPLFYFYLGSNPALNFGTTLCIMILEDFNKKYNLRIKRVTLQATSAD